MVSEMTKLIIVLGSIGMLGFIALAFTWGENLYNTLFITRADYIIIFLCGVGFTQCFTLLYITDIYKGESDSLLQISHIKGE
jgi:hypothetical protein